jgi:hypothetical protein
MRRFCESGRAISCDATARAAGCVQNQTEVTRVLAEHGIGDTVIGESGGTERGSQ